MELVIELIKLGTVGVIAGLFSSFLANRDHRHRKWWELRVNAYQTAIAALSDIVFYLERHFRAEMEYRELSEEYQREIREYWSDAFPRIRRLADSGAFLFSDRANVALKDLMRDDDALSYVEHLDNNLAKARKCLEELVACSKEDLRLKEGVFEGWLQ